MPLEKAPRHCFHLLLLMLAAGPSHAQGVQQPRASQTLADTDWHGYVEKLSVRLQIRLYDNALIGVLNYGSVEATYSMTISPSRAVTMMGVSARTADGRDVGGSFKLDNRILLPPALSGVLSLDGHTMNGSFMDAAGNGGRWRLERVRGPFSGGEEPRSPAPISSIRTLTRSNAGQLIKNSKALKDQIVTENVPLGEWRGSIEGAMKAVMRLLGSLYLIQVKTYPSRPPDQPWDVSLISLTPLGEQEKRTLPELWRKDPQQCGLLWISECWRLAMAKGQFIQVTGIVNEGRSASVEYTWNWAPTKYGALYCQMSGMAERCSGFPAPQPASAMFRLYDDGWRLVEAPTIDLR